MREGKKIAFQTLISYGGRIVASLFGFVAVSLMTRALGREQFGEYSTILAYLSLFMILADLGLQPLLTREISRTKNGEGETVSNFFTLRVLSSLFLLLGGFTAIFLFPYSKNIQLGTGIGMIGFFFLSASQLLLSVFQKHLAMHLASLGEILGRAAQLFFVFLVFRGHGGLFLFLLAMSGASFLIFFFHFVFARLYTRIRFNFDILEIRKIVRVSWPIALSLVLTLIYFKIDTIFLSFMKTQEDVGLYGVAYRILENLIFFPAIFSGIVMPLLSRETTAGNEDFKRVFKKAFHAIAIFAAPVTCGGFLLSYSIINVIGGKEFLASGAPMQALFLAVGLIFFGNLFGRAIIALDLQKQAMWVYLFGVLMNVVLNFMFIPKYSYIGAAWTTVATELMITVFLFWLIRKRTGVPLYIGNFGKPALAALGMVAVLFPAVSPMKTPLPFLGLGEAIIGGAVVYFVILYAMGGVKKRDFF